MTRPNSLTLPLLFALVLLTVPATQADDSTAGDPDQAIHELFANKKLFAKAEYKAVRAAFARRIERKYQAEIKRAFGTDQEKLAAWLDANPEIKEEFYCAINEKHDKIGAVLTLFKDLWKDNPDKLKTYWNLAVATAVTWDDPARGVYDYRGHSLRCKCTLPTQTLEAAANFKYVLDNDKELQGRGQFLPWEFLVHVVNHRTPLDERKWAVKNYLNKRVMFGQCYKEVEYDHGMFRGGTPKLAGQDYTLPNIRAKGGVCAMQADFAARVGKSLAIPAEYVRGEGRFAGVGHAWIMWVELKQVTKTQILFTLESFGRYDIDKYYTGTLNDPHTGQEILDRDMELRLSMVGYDKQGKRHADLAMRAYHLVRDQLPDASAHVDYFNKVLTLCPWNEEAWQALAKLSREGVLKKNHLKAVMVYLDKLLATFEKFPDFTFKVADDLLSVQDDLGQRTRTYEKLVALYEKADRPDLACQARLTLAGYQLEGKKHKEAATGLAATVEKFPAEGRYVPKLMDKLDEACKQFKGGSDLLAGFYLRLLPKVPTKRGDEPSKYCIALYEKAIAFFKEQKKPKEAEALANALARIRLGGKP
jgi:hypothetical protein